jgi:hypothetical protein
MNKERNRMKAIIKECIIYDDSIVISLEDTRDNYIDKNALGKIGEICISPYGIIINPNMDVCDKDIERKREQQLMKEFKELFGNIEYDPISDKYYQQIKEMISNKELTSLGYTIYNFDNDYDQKETINKKR